VVVATAASAVLALALQFVLKRTLLRDQPGADLEDLFSHTGLIATSLIVGGILITVAGYKLRAGGAATPAGNEAARPVSLASALWIGIAQGIALPFRGLSRSGATISVGMLAGVQRRVCEEFSFALAVVITPPLIARELQRFARAKAAAHGVVDIIALTKPGLIGMGMSFLAGLVALRWLSGWLENGRWHYFGFYCLAAGAAYYALAARGY
jgi:undecaprenyl-diphosphatase